jgi:hypothetical protein
VILAVAVAGASFPAAQTRPALNTAMRAKLDHSKNILEAVVTSNWQQLDRESRELARAVEDPAWSALKMPQYRQQSEAFLRATDGLVEAARLHDLEAASLGFISLAASCVSCHRYVARARIAAR